MSRISTTRLNRTFLKRLSCSKKYSTALENEEYTSTPQYPPILDLSYKATLERKKQAVYDELQQVKTVEEKQIKLNMPKYYGFKCYMLSDKYIHYNQLKLIQHVTRTHLIVNDGLPEYFNGINVDSLCQEVKNDIEEAILMEFCHYKRKNVLQNKELTKIEQAIISNAFVKNINRVLLNLLCKKHTHLKDLQMDFEPRLESSWFAGGMPPPDIVRRYRLGEKWRKDTEHEPTNRAMQYIGRPILHLRSSLPLKLVVSHSEAENSSLEVPFFKCDPRTVGVGTSYRHLANIPGFWPGEKSKFGIISYQDRRPLIKRTFNDPEDDKEAAHRQGIISSFAWLNAQANYLGFTTFNDITYPLVTQSIITDGKTWSFYIYQLNTLLNHSKYVNENPKRNICYGTTELKLFEEISDGKVVGFNDDVLKILLKLYVNAPEERLGVNMTPYLSQGEKVSADYDDDDKRNWLEREYKFLMANRPRYKTDYEIFHWEKIYKIDHNTRVLEPRRRPFELFKKPWDRTLDDRQANYIPRALRPELPRNKGRYAKEYFP